MFRDYIGDINWLMWLGLLPVYGLYEYVGTKNTLATANLQAISASNTSILMYLIGVLGTYVCIVDGLSNLIPIMIGAWLGTYYSIKLEINHKKPKHKRRDYVKELIKKIRHE
jgi:uncharacterized membrane protein YfcA